MKGKEKRITAIVLLLACSVTMPVYASADQLSPTLGQLQQAAIERNPELAVQLSAQEIAKAEVAIAKNQWLPSVSANINKTYGKGSGRFSDTTTRSRRVNDSGKVGFSITQNLYNPVLDINVDQASLNTKSAGFAVEQTYDDLTNRIVSLFLDILATQAEITLLEGQQVAVSEQKKQAQLSFEVGTVSITDVREADAKHDRIAAQLASLKWQMQARQAELSTLTGYQIEPNDYASSIQALPDVAESDLVGWLATMNTQNTQDLPRRRLGKTSTASLNFGFTCLTKCQCSENKVCINRRFSYQIDQAFKRIQSTSDLVQLLIKLVSPTMTLPIPCMPGFICLDVWFNLASTVKPFSPSLTSPTAVSLVTVNSYVCSGKLVSFILPICPTLSSSISLSGTCMITR